jgi:hypothetical protein
VAFKTTHLPKLGLLDSSTQRTKALSEEIK